MPAVTVDDLLVLPRLEQPPADHRQRAVRAVTNSGLPARGGFPVWKAFAGSTYAAVDPFLMLDQIGPVVYGPREAVGTPGIPTAGSRRCPMSSTVRPPIRIPTAVAG